MSPSDLRFPGFELVDMSEHLPGLIFRTGMTTWVPAVDRSVKTEFITYDDFMKTIPESQKADVKMLPSHQLHFCLVVDDQFFPIATLTTRSKLQSNLQWID